MAAVKNAILSPLRLQNRVAVITGGASGLGRATVEKFVANGAKVIIADIQDAVGEKLAQDLGGPDVARYIHCDVTQEEHIAAAVDLSVSAFGRLDVMHNNAGIVGIVGTIDKAQVADIDYLFGVLLRGPVLGIKHAARAMKPEQRGTIINTSSVAGHNAGLAPLFYSTFKHAVVGLTRCAAYELRGSNVRVNCISPGPIMTPIWNVLESNRAEKMKIHIQVADSGYSVKDTVGQVDDIAKGVLYLASDDSSYVNGHALVVDGSHALIPDFPLSQEAFF